MALQKVPDVLLSFLDKYDEYYLVGHKEPDGDCIGSQTALASFLRRRGKKTVLFSPGPWKRRETQEHARLFSDTLSVEEQARKAGVLVLDCSAAERIGHFAELFAGREIAVIDHHATTAEDFGDIRYIEPKAPCVTLLVQKIIEAFRDEPTREEARLLFLGFATDTGFFRHLEFEAEESLRLVSRLAAAGVTPRSVYKETFGSYSLESRLFMAEVLGTAKRYFADRFIIVHETLEESKKFREEDRQTDSLYQLLLSVENCEALAFIREEEPQKTSVSFRSADKINIGEVARGFGGGGHKNAAGFTTELSYAEIEKKILGRFEKIFAGDFMTT